MEADTYSSAIAANAVLRELLVVLRDSKVIDAVQAGQIVIGAARKLNETKDPTFEAAAKAVLALYNR
jgi:hypothetical protein